MLLTLLAAFLKDIVVSASTEGFFGLSQAQRKEIVKRTLGAEYPMALQEYLVHVSDDAFVEDITSLLPVITASHGVPGHLLESTRQAVVEDYRFDVPTSAGESSVQTVDPATIILSKEFLSDIRVLLQDIVQGVGADRRPNGFIQALAGALSQEVASAFNRKEVWIPSVPTEAHNTLVYLLKTDRVLEMTRDIQRFLQEQCSISSPVVQSPTSLTIMEQEEMRVSLQARYPGSFPLFEVEPSLGGGLRLFYKGELMDESWITHIVRAFEQLQTTS